MRSFKSIFAEAEQATAEDIQEEVRNFRLFVFKHWLQAILSTVGYWLVGNMKCMRSLRCRLRLKNEAWLAVIRKYRPMAKESYGLVQTFFDQWEEENRRFGCGSTAASHGEGEARELVKALTHNAQRELADAGYPYAPIRLDLMRGSTGWVSVELGFKYWDQLEAFFTKRVERLG